MSKPNATDPLTEAMQTVTEILTGNQLEALRSSIDALEARLVERLAELERRQEKQSEQTRKAEQGLRADQDKLSAGLSGLQLELQGQLESTEKITGLLKNAATIFSGGPPAPVASAVRDENVESAVDNMFGSEGQANRDREPTA